MRVDRYLGGSEPLPPEVVAHHQMCASAFAEGLSSDDYLAREADAWRWPFARARCVVWVLSDGGRRRASCETWGVPLRVDGQARDGWVVASVVTDPDQRGRGYATRLLTAVHAAGDEVAGAQYLMSEVDPSFYARLGYVPRPMTAHRWPARPDPTPFTWCGDADVAALVERGWCASGPVVWAPSVEQVRWHIERQRWVERARGATPSPRVGVRCGAAWALWTFDPVHRLLRVLLHEPGGDPSALADVWQAAAAHAAAVGATEVEAWGTPTRPIDAPQVPCPDVPMMRAPRGDPRGWTDVSYAHWV